MTNDWDDEDDDGEEEFGPGSADYDLSQQHGYDVDRDSWDRDEDAGPVPRWLLTWVTLAVLAALIVPSLILIWRYG
jgi:hypothetical protein